MDYASLSSEDLIVACAKGSDSAAWREFVRRFQPLIARVVLRVACQWGEPGSQVVDDLVQETYLKLCADGLRVLQSFKSAHKDAIYGYIKVLTANLTHDYFKVANSQKRGRGMVSVSLDEQKPGQAIELMPSSQETFERQVLVGQIDLCLRRITSGPVAERDRRIFWLYYRVGLTASAIADFPNIGLSIKGVESTVLRLTRQVRHRLVAPKQECSEIG